jgi:hypothetical protein
MLGNKDKQTEKKMWKEKEKTTSQIPQYLGSLAPYRFNMKLLQNTFVTQKKMVRENTDLTQVS